MTGLQTAFLVSSISPIDFTLGTRTPLLTGEYLIYYPVCCGLPVVIFRDRHLSIVNIGDANVRGSGELTLDWWAQTITAGQPGARRFIIPLSYGNMTAVTAECRRP